MTTYYMRVDGTAANKGAASGPGSTQNACMNISVHNGETFSAGDEILICDDGGIYRDQLVVQNSGGDQGSPITYKPESGDSPLMYGSVIADTWADQTGNKWRMDLGATAPKQVWFSKSGTVNHGIEEVSSAALTVEYEWWYDGSQYLWCYSTSDPDSAYEWIEAGQVASPVYVDGVDYIKFQDLEFGYGNSYGIYAQQCTGLHVISCTVHHCGEKRGDLAQGVLLSGTADALIQSCTIYEIGAHGIFVDNLSGDASTNTIIELNTIRDSYYAAIDCHRRESGTATSGIIVRYNWIYDSEGIDHSTPNQGGGIFFEGPDDDLDDVDIYYNIISNLAGNGIGVANNVTNCRIYNNTVYGAHSDALSYAGAYVISAGSGLSGVTLKNNIGMDASEYCLDVDNTNNVDACDNNLWFNAGGSKYAGIGDPPTDYDSGDQAAYKSATSWDTNGLWENPDLVDPDNQDFHLKAESPCREAGVDVGLSSDKDGVFVPLGSAPDAGCFEFVEPLTKALQEHGG